MSVSIGMAHGTGAESAAELVRRADAAMYRAKSSRAPFAIYDAAPLALG